MSMFGDVILKDYDECVQDFVKKTIELHCEDLGECIDSAFEEFYNHSGYKPPNKEEINKKLEDVRKQTIVSLGGEV